ncbi:MAG TPA: TVP38/TMEM64 family protein [bacterium]|nr:TVP38/TMEM64 family protein [bacterium]
MYSIIKVLLVAIISAVSLIYYPYLNPEHIAAFIEGNKVTAPVIFIIICTVRPVLFFLPSMGLTIVAGVLFGAAWGTVYVAIGGAFSTVVGYLFARWLGREAVIRMLHVSNRLNRLDEWSQQYGKNVIFSMRLFNLPWDMVSYWAGLTGIRFKEFYLASMIPLLPISFLYTYFGSKVFQPQSTGFIVSLLIMFILGAIPFIKWKLKKRAYG